MAARTQRKRARSRTFFDRNPGQLNLMVTAPCAIHRWILQTPPVRDGVTERRVGTRRWRCKDCKRWTEAPVSRRHELNWRNKVRMGALPDQVTIYDALGLGVVGDAAVETVSDSSLGVRHEQEGARVHAETTNGVVCDQL